VFNIAGQPELKEHNGNGACRHQESITLRVDAMIIPQIDRERAVHLLINEQHNNVSGDEGYESGIAQHEAIACQCFQERFAFFVCLRLGFGFRDRAKDNDRNHTTDN